MAVLNDEYKGTPFSFIWKNLDAVTVVNNTEWTSDLCLFVRHGTLQDDWVFLGDFKTSINVYLSHQINIVRNLTTGCGSFPRKDVNYIGMDFEILPPGGNGLTPAHEVAHWLGLLHTFTSTFNPRSGDPCHPNSKGDCVDDTPIQTKFNYSLYVNQTSSDSCPPVEGDDSFWNLMNSVCFRHACFGDRAFFTEGQIQRMVSSQLLRA